MVNRSPSVQSKPPSLRSQACAAATVTLVVAVIANQIFDLKKRYAFLVGLGFGAWNLVEQRRLIKPTKKPEQYVQLRPPPFAVRPEFPQNRALPTKKTTNTVPTTLFPIRPSLFSLHCNAGYRVRASAELNRQLLEQPAGTYYLAPCPGSEDLQLHMCVPKTGLQYRAGQSQKIVETYDISVSDEGWVLDGYGTYQELDQLLDALGVGKPLHKPHSQHQTSK